jgi:hypothetical protein
VRKAGDHAEKGNGQHHAFKFHAEKDSANANGKQQEQAAAERSEILDLPIHPERQHRAENAAERQGNGQNDGKTVPHPKALLENHGSPCVQPVLDEVIHRYEQPAHSEQSDQRPVCGALPRSAPGSRRFGACRVRLRQTGIFEGQRVVADQPRNTDCNHQNRAEQERAAKEIKQIEDRASAIGNHRSDDNRQAHGKHRPLHHHGIHGIAQNQHKRRPENRLADSVEKPQILDRSERHAAEHRNIEDCRHAENARNDILSRIKPAENRMNQLSRAVGKEEKSSRQPRFRARDIVERHDRRNVCVVAVAPRIGKTVDKTGNYNQNLLFPFQGQLLCIHFRCSPIQTPMRSVRASHSSAEASLGILQSPRGERQMLPSFTPSGRQLRLNCCVKKRR